MIRKFLLHTFLWIFLTGILSAFFLYNKNIHIGYRGGFNMIWWYCNLYLHTKFLVPVLERNMNKWKDKEGILDLLIRRIKNGY